MFLRNYTFLITSRSFLTSCVYMVLPRKPSLVTPYLMTGAAHEGGSDKRCGWEGSGVPLDQPHELRVTVYDPLRGVPVAELEVTKSKEKERHG